MITLNITGNTLCDDAIALEKKGKKDVVHVSPLVARHRLNIQGFAGSQFTTSDKIILFQQTKGYTLAAIHIEYNLDKGIHAVSTWVKKNTEIREIYCLKTSIALVLRSKCPVYIEKPLYERIKDKEVIRENERYSFKDPLLYRLDLNTITELKDLLVEHSLVDDLANVELIKSELKQRIAEGKISAPATRRAI